VKSSTEHLQFSRKTWQKVTQCALDCAKRLGSDQNACRLENLRPVHFIEESETQFGSQVWCFEISRNRTEPSSQPLLAPAPTSSAPSDSQESTRKMEFGALIFSLEFGILELSHSRWFASASQREAWLAKLLNPSVSRPPSTHLATPFWIACAVASILLLASGWILSVIRFLQPGG
jgi:hypothetical protein